MTIPTVHEIERRAFSGDAEAQYALAAILSERQQQDLARHWLERAASLGHADALFTLAGALLTKTEGAIEQRGEAVAGLQKARENGSIAALRTLAALTAAGLVGDEGWPGALAMMREACERGEAASLREIATLILEADEKDEDGGALLVTAAKSDALAAALVARRARRGLPTNEKCVSLSDAFGKLLVVKNDVNSEQICSRPRITAFRAAVGRDLCDHLVGAALPRLKREQVLGADGLRRTDPHRTAWGALLGFGFADLPAVIAGQRMASLAQLSYSNGEPLSILRYLPGQEYKIHHDFLGPNDPDLLAHGQRLKTALLYLNDGYAGGETHFLVPDIRFAGKTGDILVFHNVDESGALDYSARHAGRTIERGEKWIASLWLRDRPFAG